MSLTVLPGTTVIRQGVDNTFQFGHAEREFEGAPIVPVNLAGCSFFLQLRKDPDGEVFDELSTLNNRIVIDDAIQGWYSLIWPADVTKNMSWYTAKGDLIITYQDGTKDMLWRHSYILEQAYSKWA